MQTFKQFLNEGPLPPEWEKDVYTPKTSFAKRIKYAIERSKRLGTGSSRVAFNVPFEGRQTVLKIAKNVKGLAQNSKEADYSLYRMYPEITIPLIDFDEQHDEPLWIHFEKAEKLTKPLFKKMTGFAFDDFTNLLMLFESENNGKPIPYYLRNKISLEEKKRIEQSELYSEVVNLIGTFDILAADLSRLANWGIYNNKPVIIDLGFRPDVAKQFYNRR